MEQNFSSIETIVIGEMHGVVENVQVIKDTIKLIEPFKKVSCIALEYPRELLPLFEKALRDNNFALLEANKDVTQLLNDGRFSQAHFVFLTEIYNKKIKLLFIDCLDKKWDYRDRAMYELIQNAKHFLPAEKVMIVVVGNLHSSIETLVVEGRPYIPLGSYFHEQVLFITTTYLAGSYWNNSLKQFASQNNDIVPKTQFEELSEKSMKYYIQLAHPTRTS